MLPTRYRRLWRRRLRRRPLLPFLLAATLAVDLAMLFRSGVEDSHFFGGLLGGQIGLLAIWVTHQARGLPARLFTALALVLLSLQFTMGYPVHPAYPQGTPEFFYNFDPRPFYYSVILLMLAVDLITAGFVRGAVARWRRSDGIQARVRTQISTLLWITLILATLLSFGGYGAWEQLSGPLAISLLPILLNCLPLTVMLTLWLSVSSPSWRVHWLLVVPCTCLLLARSLTGDSLALYCTTYATFLGVWLYLAGDRGPAPEPGPTREPIEELPASIDLRA
ncbi:hypothetical protein MalM25_33710 [Planctomycetes bacterium MalM25]|nr:hypothetical protein MalM25_33710 [Planctomycetes bacterium MalM25]